jgi:hypothetical protein
MIVVIVNCLISVFCGRFFEMVGKRVVGSLYRSVYSGRASLLTSIELSARACFYSVYSKATKKVEPLKTTTSPGLSRHPFLCQIMPKLCQNCLAQY